MEELWDIARVASYLGVTERTVYNKVRSGDLPAIKVGRLWRVRRADLEAWLAAGAPASDQAELVAEPGAMPSRHELEVLLAPLAESLERRLAFVGLLSRGVESLGWSSPVVIGGHAVEFYTAGSYATVDIDLAGDSEPVGRVLDGWCFQRQGRHWFDEELRLVVEVPGGPLGPDELAHVTRVRIGRLIASVIGIEDLIVDRLNACKYWGDQDSCDWARTMILAADELDMEYMRKRAADEDVADTLDSVLPAEGS